MLDTFEIVVAVFLVIDKANWVRFFEKTIPLANISPKVVFGMPFLTLSSANIDFSVRELRLRTYTSEKTLLITRCVELMGKKKFAAVVLNLEQKTYVVYVKSVRSIVLLNSAPLKLDFNLFCKSQMSSLIAEEASTKIRWVFGLCKYIFSGFDVQTSQAHQKQQLRYQTSW